MTRWLFTRSTPRCLATAPLLWPSAVRCCAGLASPPLIMRASTHGMFHCGRDSLVESACVCYRDGRNSKHPSPVAKWRSSLLPASIASSTNGIPSKPIRYFQVHCPLIYLTFNPPAVGSANPSTEHQATLLWEKRKVNIRSNKVSRPLDRWAECWHSVFETEPHSLLRGVCSVGVLHRSCTQHPGDLTLDSTMLQPAVAPSIHSMCCGLWGLLIHETLFRAIITASDIGSFRCQHSVLQRVH
jgi:hypothetical protein